MKRDFSKKTLAQLTKKGISVIGAQAVPAFDGDKYFSGSAYKLEWNGTGFLRTFDQVLVLAASSWDPATDLNPSA